MAKFILTTHVLERFVERTNKKFSHLTECKSSTCEQCERLKVKVKARVAREEDQIRNSISNRIHNSEESKCHLNNSSFMIWIYEKYGYDRSFQFLVHEGLLFVVIHERGQNLVVTCIPSKYHLAGRAAARPKFRKKPNES